MCETVLVRSLLNCSDIGCKVEFSPLCGLVIVPDVVGHPVVELADAHRRIIRQLLKVLRKCGCRDEESRDAK